MTPLRSSRLLLVELRADRVLWGVCLSLFAVGDWLLGCRSGMECPRYIFTAFWEVPIHVVSVELRVILVRKISRWSTAFINCGRTRTPLSRVSTKHTHTHYLIQCAMSLRLSKPTLPLLSLRLHVLSWIVDHWRNSNLRGRTVRKHGFKVMGTNYFEQFDYVL